MSKRVNVFVYDAMHPDEIPNFDDSEQIGNYSTACMMLDEMGVDDNDGNLLVGSLDY